MADRMADRMELQSKLEKLLTLVLDQGDAYLTAVHIHDLCRATAADLIDAKLRSLHAAPDGAKETPPPAPEPVCACVCPGTPNGHPDCVLCGGAGKRPSPASSEPDQFKANHETHEWPGPLEDYRGGDRCRKCRVPYFAKDSGEKPCPGGHASSEPSEGKGERPSDEELREALGLLNLGGMGSAWYDFRRLSQAAAFGAKWERSRATQQRAPEGFAVSLTVEESEALRWVSENWEIVSGVLYNRASECDRVTSSDVTGMMAASASNWRETAGELAAVGEALRKLNARAGVSAARPSPEETPAGAPRSADTPAASAQEQRRKPETGPARSSSVGSCPSVADAPENESAGVVHRDLKPEGEANCPCGHPASSHQATWCWAPKCLCRGFGLGAETDGGSEAKIDEIRSPGTRHLIVSHWNHAPGPDASEGDGPRRMYEEHLRHNGLISGDPWESLANNMRAAAKSAYRFVRAESEADVDRLKRGLAVCTEELERASARTDDYGRALQSEKEHVGFLSSELNETREKLTESEGRIRELQSLINRDRTGLAAALGAVLEACKGSWWITDGRGPYEWDDDKYREETRWFIERVMGIAGPALQRSGSLAQAAFHPNTKPVATYNELEKILASRLERLSAAEQQLAALKNELASTTEKLHASESRVKALEAQLVQAGQLPAAGDESNDQS